MSTVQLEISVSQVQTVQTELDSSSFVLDLVRPGATLGQLAAGMAATISTINANLAANYSTTSVSDGRYLRADIANLNPPTFVADVLYTSAAPTLTGFPTVDGVALGAGNLVLVTGNNSPNTARGIYVAAAGAWSRWSGTPTGGAFITGTVIRIKSGTSAAGSTYYLNNSGTWDTTAPVIPRGSTKFGGANGTDTLDKATGDTLYIGLYDTTRTPTLRARFLTGVNQALTGNPGTIDGLAAANNDVILLVGQTTGSQNGLWVINTAGAWFRPGHYPSGVTARGGLMVYILGGVIWQRSVFVLQQDALVDTNSTTWSTLTAKQGVADPGDQLRRSDGDSLYPRIARMFPANTSEWVLTPCGVDSTFNYAANDARMGLIRLPAGKTITRLGFLTTIAGGVGATARIFMYADDGFGRPTGAAPLYDSGLFATDDAIGFHGVTGITVPSQDVWTGYVHQGAAAPATVSFVAGSGEQSRGAGFTAKFNSSGYRNNSLSGTPGNANTFFLNTNPLLMGVFIS